jgi:DNA-binding LytR/AlgR family response regulator
MEDSLNCMLVYDITPFITNKDHRFIKIPVNSGKEITLIDPADIFYLEADNIYAKVHTYSGVYFCDFSLRFLEERLPSEHFYRIHRSYMVNLSKVEKIIKERQSYYLQIQNSDIRLPVSRNKAADFSKKMGLK